MPKQNQNNSILPFQGGLNTEANRFNYPPECTLDEQNFILTKDGKRERRLGIVLSDEDIDLAPEGILFEDKIRIVNDEGTDITEQLVPVTETYTEQKNYNVTTKYTGYIDHILTLSNKEKIRLRVYQNGIYAELYIIKPNGNTTLYKKYNKGDTIVLPYSLNKWDSNQASKPNMSFILLNKNTINTEIENWLRTFTKKETTKTDTFTSDWLPLIRGAEISRTDRKNDRTGGSHSSNSYTSFTTYGLTIGDKGYKLNYSSKGFIDKPNELTYVSSWEKNKSYPLPASSYANLTKDSVTIIRGNYGTTSDVRDYYV